MEKCWRDSQEDDLAVDVWSAGEGRGEGLLTEQTVAVILRLLTILTQLLLPRGESLDIYKLRASTQRIHPLWRNRLAPDLRPASLQEGFKRGILIIQSNLFLKHKISETCGKSSVQGPRRRLQNVKVHQVYIITLGCFTLQQILWCQLIYFTVVLQSVSFWSVSCFLFSRQFVAGWFKTAALEYKPCSLIR